MRTACTLFHYNSFPAFLYEVNPITLLIINNEEDRNQETRHFIEPYQKCRKAKTIKITKFRFYAKGVFPNT